MITIGIDPGLSGAVGVLSAGAFLCVEDIPVMHKGDGVVKNHIDAAGLSRLLKKFPEAQVIIEGVYAMPNQGTSSVFSLGDSFGVCRGVCASLELSVQFVHPSKWKKYYDLTSDKERARAKAINMFPSAPLELKKYSDRAEALLLSNYLYQLLR